MYTPDELHDLMMPNPADDVPYIPDRPVTLKDTTGRNHHGYRSRSHENMIRVLLDTGWRCVERLPDDSGWCEVEYVP